MGAVHLLSIQFTFEPTGSRMAASSRPAATLIDDEYVYKERTHSFVGARERRRYELGARVRVRLDSADQGTFRLTFSIV